MALFNSTSERISCGIWLMMAMGAPGLDGCELLTPTNRLLVFFLVGVGLCVGAVAASPGGDILVRSRLGSGSPTAFGRLPCGDAPQVTRVSAFTAGAPSPAKLLKMSSQHRHHLDRLDGRCAMRGSCGSKGIFGKPLPCPYDGPSYEV